MLTVVITIGAGITVAGMAVDIVAVAAQVADFTAAVPVAVDFMGAAAKAAVCMAAVPVAGDRTVAALADIAEPLHAAVV